MSEVAFLEWAAHCPTATVEDGADSFIIRQGRIVVQTIHCTVRKLPGDDPRGSLRGPPDP